MEEDLYSRLPKLKIEINLATIIWSIIIILFAFVIPVSLIQRGSQTEGENNIIVSGPQVAGVSTEKQPAAITLPIIDQQVYLEGQSGLLIMIGLLLLGIGLIIILYLIVDTTRKKKN